MEGLAAVAITSFLANLVAKGLFRRRRPTDQVPEGAASPDANLLLDALRPRRMLPSHSRRGRHIPVCGSHSMPSPPRSDSLGSTPEYTTPADVIAGWLLGKGSERWCSACQPLPDVLVAAHSPPWKARSSNDDHRLRAVPRRTASQGHLVSRGWRTRGSRLRIVALFAEPDAEDGPVLCRLPACRRRRSTMELGHQRRSLEDRANVCW